MHTLEAMEGLPSMEAAIDEMESHMTDSRLSRGIPADPLLGVLPLRRLVPQDVHSLMDFGNATFSLGAALACSSPRARLAAGTLGASLAAISLCTDVRLSAVRVIPVRWHELSDHAFGLACLAAPWVLGYARKEPLFSAFQMLVGATTVIASLCTDYRAWRGR